MIVAMLQQISKKVILLGSILRNSQCAENNYCCGPTATSLQSQLLTNHQYVSM